MSKVPNNWTYADEMRQREEEKVTGLTQCGVLGNPEYAGRCCPSDGVTKCKDCPFVDL